MEKIAELTSRRQEKVKLVEKAKKEIESIDEELMRSRRVLDDLNENDGNINKNNQRE